jgi:DNA-binding Lrp family transcriptional regulator
MTDQEKALARLIQADIPMEKRPFETMGKAVGLTGKDVLALIRQWKEQGLLRKVAVIVRHQRVGYTQNAMVLWSVPEEDCETAGTFFAAFPEITHCYERTPPEGRYNLFRWTTIGSSSRETVDGFPHCRCQGFPNSLT